MQQHVNSQQCILLHTVRNQNKPILDLKSCIMTSSNCVQHVFVYTGAILPLLQYGAPIWIKALEKASYKIKLIRIQRLINIRIAKSFRTVSNEAPCIINGLTPIDIKLEETVQLFQLTRRNKSEKDHDTRTTNWPQNIDYDAQPEEWLHPADSQNHRTP